MANRNEASLPSNAWIAISAVVVATTFGPIFLRAAQLEGVPSVYIITARLFLTSLLIGPFVMRSPANFGQLTRSEWAWAGLAGLFLAINLLMLVFALEYTSVLVTGILRRISPMWVIGMEIAFLAAAFTRRVWVGLFVTIAGSVVVALGSAGAIEPGSAPVFGATLAIIGSVCMAFYLLIGRKLKDALPSLAYSWLVFTIAGLITFGVMVATDVPLTGYSTMGYVWVVGATFVAQILGHIALNATLQYVPATYISLIMQLSIAMSGVVAYFAFRQVPSMWQVIGSIAVVVGVMVATWQSPREKLRAE